jgi:outer membrane murein-binding lipoprotein Lpp
MKYMAVVAAISASIMLGGCFSSVISNYEIPNDITSKQCKVAADCTDNGGGGGAGS